MAKFAHQAPSGIQASGLSCPLHKPSEFASDFVGFAGNVSKFYRKIAWICRQWLPETSKSLPESLSDNLL
jgi:hypothetical protein